MNIQNLVIPMRAQPFHKGHESLLEDLSSICIRGAVFLNKKYDADNPFPFLMRKHWIERFLSLKDINNITVAHRNDDLSEDRVREYILHFSSEHIVVLATYETEGYLRDMGFQVINHHDPEIRRMLGLTEVDPAKICGTGATIRKLLRIGCDCSHYLSPYVEYEAREFIRNTMSS